jgi:SAM-dependent methyltransferase
MATDDWNMRAAPWLETPLQPLWRRHSDAVNSMLVARWLDNRHGSVLKTDLFDEAVGEGVYPALAARADRVVGIDISSAIVGAAGKRHPALSAHRADVRTLPFADGEFGAIFSNSTLDHFDSSGEIVAALRECRRVLEPGGQLIVTLDNPWNPVIALSKNLPREQLNRLWPRLRFASAIGLQPYRVGATLSVTRLREVLTELGFHVHETGAIIHAPRVVAVLAAELLQRRGGEAAKRRFLRALMLCERLSHSPVRFVTGHFVGARATKPAGKNA